MREFTFVAKDKQGKTIREDMFATSEKQLVELLHKRGYTVIRIDPIRSRSLYDRLFHTVRTELKVLIFRQMSAMLSSGIPILRVVNSLSDNEGLPPHFHRALKHISAAMSSGYSLSQALRLFPEYFSPFMVGSIRIGEVSGDLAATIEHCTEHLNKEYSYDLKLRQAMIYPTVLLSCLTILMIFCFAYMIPIFMGMFQEVQVELPWPTKILLATTTFLRSQGLRLILTSSPIAIFGCYIFYRWRKTYSGRWHMENFLLRIPWYGKQIRLRLQSTYLRSFAVLIDSSIPLMSSLDLLSKSLDYEILRATARFQMDTIKAGGDITSGMRRSGLFKPLVLEMIHLSEETATVPQTMKDLATILDEEMSNGLKLLSSLIEPFVLSILGIGVTFILLAVFLPIYTLAQSF